MRRFYCHFDSLKYMIHQKVFEQNRWAVSHDLQQKEVWKHAMDVYLNFTWSEITTDQVEKAIFATFYVWLASIIALFIRDRSQENRKHRCKVFSMEIFMCGMNMEGSEDICYALYLTFFVNIENELGHLRLMKG